LEKGKHSTDTPVEADVAPYMGHAGTAAAVEAAVHCPLDAAKTFDSSYTINACNVAPVCQIMGADATYPHALPN